MTCSSCGEKPKDTSKDFPKAVVEINNPESLVLFRKVVVPSSLGDDTDIPAAIGKYHNVLLQYEKNGNTYLYSSDGIPTKITTDDFELPIATTEVLGGIKIGAGLESSSDGTVHVTSGGVADSVAWGHIVGPITDQTDLTSALNAKVDASSLATVATTGDYDDLVDKPTLSTVAETGNYNDLTNKPSLATVATTGDYDDLTDKPNLATVATTGNYNDLSNKPTIPVVPTNVSAFTNDAGYITSSVLPTKTSDLVNDGADNTSTYVEHDELATVATSGLYSDLSGTPTIPTVNDAVLTVQKNSVTVDTFTANSASNKTIDITVPVTAADVSALPDSTKYGSSITVTFDSVTQDLTTTLKDQDGNTLGTAQVINLPATSMIVSGSYDSVNKEIVLVLQNSNTIRIPVADLVSGLQTEITAQNMLDADLVDDSTSVNKFVTASDISSWNGKQDALTAGNNITINNNTISATDTTYLAGNGLDLTGNTFSADTTVLATQTDLAGKQDALTAGSNININGTTISATDTTYSAGTGLSLSSDTFSVDSSVVALQSDIPTKTSDLTNDGSDNTSTYVEADELATVATTGSYSDLSGTPSLATVATSGDYDDLTNKPTIPTVPTNVSAFTNDAGYITSSSLPTKTSDLTNDGSDGTSTYVEASSLATVATTGAYSDLSGTPNLATVATSGSYNDLSNTPTIPTVNDATLTIQKNSTTIDTFTANASQNKTIDISVPTKTSDLTNDGSDTTHPFVSVEDLAAVAVSGDYADLKNTPFIPAAQVNSDWDAASGVAQILNKPTLATVATSGSYNDLSNKPTIPAAQVNSDWNASSGIAQILNKPTLATVATSGAYSDLSGTPSLATVATSGAYSDLSGTPTIGDGTLTIQQNGTNVATFTANSSSNATANISVPTFTITSTDPGEGQPLATNNYILVYEP